VAKVVICPSCEHKGSIPDDLKAPRIRCPKCKQSFDVAAATQKSAGPAKAPAAAKRPAAAVETAFTDLESVEPLPTFSTSSSNIRRTPSVLSRAQGAAGLSPMVYAAMGIGGLAVVLLGVVLVVVLTRGGGEPHAAANVDRQEVAQNDSPAPAPVIEPIALRSPGVSTPAAPTPVAEDTSGSTSAPSAAIDGPEIIKRLKEATVYIKHNVAGKTLGSGTGFVIEVRDDTVMLATNRHVAVVDVSDMPPSLVPKGAKVELEVVFRSGQGPQKEQSVPAQIIAADTTEDFSTDLAILVVKGVKNPPKPLSVFAKSETTEGMAYTGAGFPLGGMLSKVNDNKGNPSVTITRGGIARLVNDDHGQLDLFQVDGSLQPGNSGGPIVEEKTGKLIGVAVAKVGSVDTIGFVVPAEQVRRTLAGRIGYLGLTLQAMQQGSADLQINAQVVDPKNVVKGVTVHVAPASAGMISPNSDGSWPPLPNSTTVELERDQKVAMASGKVKVTLSGQGVAARKVLIQTAHRDQRNQLVYSKPKEYELPERPGPIVQQGQLQRTIKLLRRKSYSLIGQLTDPDKDCKLVKDEDSMKLKIEIPGEKVHTLSPELVTRLNKKKPMHNAPMVLTEVDGDFVAMVKVTGEIKAGAKLPKDRQGNNTLIAFTFQAAGLILYQDKDNFLRLERSGGVNLQNLQGVHKVLIEAVKEGKQAMQPVYVPFPDQDTLLILIKRKGKVRCLFSPDDGNTLIAMHEFELDLPTKIKVGLVAGNISSKPYIANFEDFTIVNDTTMIDAQFGDAESPKKK
jgi:hypothetical protein